jgi:biotin carboxylase
MAIPRLLLLLPSTTYRAGAFVAAAGRLGVALTVGSDHRSTLASLQPDALLTLDFSDPDRLVDQVSTFHRSHPLAAVVGVDDDSAVAAARIACTLRLRHASLEACLAARDKHLQRQRLREAGCPVPGSTLHPLDADLAALARAVRYPCVIKPLRLSMSRGVMRADDAPAFVACVQRLRSILREPDAAARSGERAGLFLVEDYVSGPEFAVEALLPGGALTVLALFDKPDPLEGPFFEETIYVTPSRLPEAEQARIATCVARAAAAIGLAEGPVHAEVRLNAEGPWLIELAARPIGGRCSGALRFGPAADLSLEELVLRHALGMPLTAAALRRERAASAVLMIPTPRAGTLERVDGVDEARRVPGVEDVVVTAHPGQLLVPLPEGSRYLGFIFARGERPAEAEAAVRRAHAVLRIVPR